MLKDLLEKKQCFKLVCGAGNEDITEIERLVTIYSLAGCQFFDVSANVDVVDAAKRGLANAGIEENRYICVSVGIDGDPHITKAIINEEKCIKCGICYKKCPHDAISTNNEIIQTRCLGCSQCTTVCPQNAISMKSQIKDYKEILPEIISKGVDCIEFHAISNNEDDVNEKWQIINSIFKGLLCISLDRSELGDKKLIERVRRMIKDRPEYSTIIQADGIAMSGNNDELGTTLQAVATAQLFQNSELPIYIMMSGGTNTKSTELAKACGVKPHCIAIGSYARKIVKNYINDNEFPRNSQKLNEAVNIAKSLIDTSLRNMIDD